LRWYNADAHTWEHRDRALREGHPGAVRWEAMTPDERWLTASPAEMLELSIDLERGPMVVDDLRGLLASPLTLAEGTTVLPELVGQGFADASRAVWLAPPLTLQRARLEERGMSENIVEFHLLMAAEIDRQARVHGVTVVRVDPSDAVDETVAELEALFADALVTGPVAEEASERRALLRYANETTVSQCLAYLARPWTTSDAESFVGRFVCECDDRDCAAVVELPVATFVRVAEAGPVLAAGHG
jgi:hypothetical protein